MRGGFGRKNKNKNIIEMDGRLQNPAIHLEKKCPTTNLGVVNKSLGVVFPTPYQKATAHLVANLDFFQ
jgi:hypothetical protein